MDDKPDLQPPLCDRPQYLQGQILALRALVLSLADITADAPSLRASGRAALERLRTALLSQPVAETQLMAVEEMERWLETVTQDGPYQP